MYDRRPKAFGTTFLRNESSSKTKAFSCQVSSYDQKTLSCTLLATLLFTNFC